jgi:hypothetical protein
MQGPTVRLTGFEFNIIPSKIMGSCNFVGSTIKEKHGMIYSASIFSGTSEC